MYNTVFVQKHVHTISLLFISLSLNSNYFVPHSLTFCSGYTTDTVQTSTPRKTTFRKGTHCSQKRKPHVHRDALIWQWVQECNLHNIMWRRLCNENPVHIPLHHMNITVQQHDPFTACWASKWSLETGFSTSCILKRDNGEKVKNNQQSLHVSNLSNFSKLFLSLHLSNICAHNDNSPLLDRTANSIEWT